MRISDWSSDVCSSDLFHHLQYQPVDRAAHGGQLLQHGAALFVAFDGAFERSHLAADAANPGDQLLPVFLYVGHGDGLRSEERRVGKSVSVRVDLGGRRIIKQKKSTNKSKKRIS